MGVTSPPAIPRTLKILCVLNVLGKVKQCAKFQRRISVDHAVMPICILHRLSIVCAQKWGFGGFWGEDVKILSSDPQKALPCVDTRLCWCIACQNRFNGLSCRSVERFCVQRKKEMEKNCGNFGYMGRSNPWRDLDQMWLLGRYGGRNHVCNICWLSVKGCGCGERGKFAFSHWLNASPLQHWSHYCVTVWFQGHDIIQR